MNNELLTVKELSKVIKLSQQTIYNMIHKKEFVLNHHYYKPSPKKILFKWAAIENWLHGDMTDESIGVCDAPITNRSLIRI